MANKFIDLDGLGHVWSKIKSKMGDYLPLSGGKMTNTKAMSRDVNTSFLGLHGGTGENNDGAQLFLCGANHPDLPSQFQLHARNSTTQKTLLGKVDGYLEWDGRYVLNNAFSMPANTSGINLNSGTDYESGAYVRLYGKENTESAGNFVIAASDGTNLRKFEGNVDGSLKWNDNDVITSAGGTLTGNLVRNGLLATSSATGQSMWLTAGGGTSTGAGLWLYGSTASNTGQFTLRAHDGTTYKDLIGKPDGTLTWAGKSLIPSSGTDVFYATCSTAGDTAAKVATVTSGTFSLKTGVVVLIKSTNTFSGGHFGKNTTLTLNVSSSGAKNLYHDNGTTTWGYKSASGNSTYYEAGNFIICVYDGTNWRVFSEVDKISYSASGT